MLIKHFDDYSFTVKAYPESHYVKFEIFEIKGTNAEDRLYGADAGLRLDEAPLYVHGTVKWDGCSDWQIDEPVCLHFCTRGGVSDLGSILTSCWDWASELIDCFEGE